MHFSLSPHFDVCQMTKTTRARCTNGPLERADGISPPTSFGDLITADHRILNLDDESSNDHQNSLIAQDEYSNWLKNATNAKDAAEKALFL